MTITETASLPDVKIIKPRIFPDARGFFMQAYHEKKYRAAGLSAEFVQDNRSRSAKGVLRGLHYQLTHAQDKLVSVIRGSVLDVAVDLRRSSPAFGKWTAEILSDENHHQMFVPKGFAHGFLVLSDEADLFYKCSDFYDPKDEYGVFWNDPSIGIEWPDGEKILSEKDRALPVLAEIAPENLFE